MRRPGWLTLLSTPGPEPDPVVCGPCGRSLSSAEALAGHAAECWTPAPAPDANLLLANATVGLVDRVPAPHAQMLAWTIQRTARDLSIEQRARLAWLVNEVADAIDALTRPGAGS